MVAVCSGCAVQRRSTVERKNMMHPSALSLTSLVALAAATAAADAAKVPATALNWHLPRYASLEENILTIDVPEEAAREGCRAWADVDLSAYDGLPLEATVEARGERIGIPRNPWNGWSVEHEGPDAQHMVPSADNSRKRALLEGLGR